MPETLGGYVQISETTSLSQDVTLVYDELDLSRVDMNELKSLAEADPGPTAWDTPDVKLVVYPPTGTTVQLAERRLIVALKRQGSEIGQAPLLDVAIGAHKHVCGLGSKLVAYGFNFEAGLTVSGDDAASLTRQSFLRDDAEVERALGGKLLAFAPKFVFSRDACLCTLRLDPIGAERLKVSLNVHFGGDDVKLPDGPDLAQLFKDEYNRMLQDVQTLLP